MGRSCPGEEVRVEVPEAFNLAAWLLDGAEARGDGGRVAVRSGGVDLTYEEVADRAARAAAVLRDRGVRPEERVLLALPDGPDLLAAVLGALLAGAVVVPAPDRPGLADHAHLVAHSRARLAVAAPEVAAACGPDTFSAADLAAAVDAAEPWAGAEATSRDDPAFWLYTSGTTGRPKAAVHLHGDMAHCWSGFGSGVLGLGPGDRTFSVARMTSPSGIGNSIVFPLAAGASTVLGTDVAAVLRDDGPTVLFARPANYRALLEDEAAVEAPALRLAVSSGDTLPADLHRRFRERFGVEILEGTGSTEAFHVYLCNRPGRVRPGSSGEVVPGYEARLVDDDGGDVPDGEVGQLLVRGGSVCSHYARDRDRSKDAILGHWLVTGDRYRRDGDGVFWYVGRADDTWFQDGAEVAPFPIEEALGTHPAVREAGVAGVDVEPGRRRPVAWVVVREGGPGEAGEALAAELTAHVAAALGEAMAPAAVRFVDALPRTATGKVQRFRLRESWS
jgi:benzoate-CoA ligase